MCLKVNYSLIAADSVPANNNEKTVDNPYF